MISDQLRRGMMEQENSHNNVQQNIQYSKSWAKQQILRIEELSEEEVLSELQNIMEGRNYSWYCISDLLQSRFEDGTLEFTLQDGDILFEWNNLCDEKRVWEETGQFSVDNADFNKDCLINLTILPFKAGLSVNGPLLVTTNMDQSCVLLQDLWVGRRDHEGSRNYPSSSCSLSGSEDSDYVDEYENSEREDEDEEDAQFSFPPTPYGSDQEESETSSNDSYDLDHAEVEGVTVDSEGEYSDLGF